MPDVSDKPLENRRWRIDLADLAPLLTLSVLVFFFSLTGRSFFHPGTVTQILEQGAVMGIVAAGLTFVLLCGEIDLSVGNMALWTACLCGVLYELPAVAGKGGDKAVPSAFLVAAVILLPLLKAVALGWLSGVLTVTSRLPSFIITLSMMYIASGLSLYLTKSEQFHIPWFLERLGNGGISVTARLKLPYSALLAGAILLIGHLVLQYTRFGRYVYMTGGNREAARLAGVRTTRIVTACLALSAFTAGLAGLVNAGRLGSITLDQNADLLLNAVACVVLGGTSLFGGEGGILRTVIGVLTLSVLRVGLDKINWIDNYLRTYLLGVVLLGALVLNGFLARRRRSV
jgi:ribose transport system permease protein